MMGVFEMVMGVLFLSLIILVIVYAVVGLIKIELDTRRELREIDAISGNKTIVTKVKAKQKEDRVIKQQNNTISKKQQDKRDSSIKQNLTPEMEEYFKAMERKDIETMEKCLLANAEKCPSRNSYCLTEMFCPECPLSKGALAVKTSLQGLNM